MRRKVLKNTAFTLCHMFSGWQLMNDYDTITRLGSGTLDIDALSGECRYNGDLIPSLSIAKVLGAYLREDLERYHVPIALIQEARLTVDMLLERHEGQRDPSRVWARPSRQFIGCTLAAHSRVRTDEATYATEYRDTVEWPAPDAA